MPPGVARALRIGSHARVVKLSVVVTVVDGGATLARCLEALARQERPPPTEVLVPFDASLDVGPLRARFADVRWIDLGRVECARPASSEAGRHEFYDRRRAAGLAAATGEVVALLEDRGAPRPDWSRTVERLHARPHGGRRPAAIGGAIECASPGWLGKAVYLCDFGRYGLPRPAGPSDALSDTNVSYRREALQAVRATWQDRFHEPRVHAALAEHGGLWFSHEVVVVQLREGLSLGRLLAERFHWGRLFGAERARAWPLRRRLAFILASPLLPLVLWAKIADERVARHRWLPAFWPAQLALVPLLVGWSLGEAVGYATRRG